MKKYMLSAILAAGCSFTAFAQNDTTKTKEINHAVGVQINGLIKQVFNFNNSNTPTGNPYLLTYSLNAVKTGWGARMGVGYVYTNNASNDGTTDLTTTINEMQARLGIEKSFKLSHKWSAGIGIDGLANINDNKTVSKVVAFDTVTTVTKSAVNSFGGGAMGWLRYSITPHIQIGTEASVYYTTGKQTQSVAITRRAFTTGGGSNITTKEMKSEPTLTNVATSLPVVFYLLVRF